MKKVIIEPGCVSCGSCQAICPQVFKLERGARVLLNADFKKHESLIKEAAELCPVQVIKIIEEQPK
jgi:ferredoxin